MQHPTDASYYQRREREEMERAHQARATGARQSHLGLAALYRKQLAQLNYEDVTPVDMPAERQR